RLAIDEIAFRVALPRFHECDVGRQARLQDVRLAVDDACFLAFGDERPGTGLRVEAVDARTARANAFGERALRIEFERELAGQILALELSVLADVRGNHFADLASLEQQPEALAIHAGIVRDHGEVARAGIAERENEVLRNPA